MSNLRTQGHWEAEDYKQRVTTKEWREILLDGDDRMIFHGRVRQLVGKKLGAGVVEISKASLEDTTETRESQKS